VFELKRLTPEGIARALEKVERYRLLNEPWEAESICRDVLEVDPDNQEALVSLLLAMTDRFSHETGPGIEAVRALLPRISGAYEHAYYAGIICERKASAVWERGLAGSGPRVYDWLREAMEHYEVAESLRPAGNDDALLRWNTCARMIMDNHQVRPLAEERTVMMLE
jgi:hypothetical protein